VLDQGIFVPSGDIDLVQRAHRSTQPMTPDGTATPIDDEGILGAPMDDDVTIRGER